MVQEDEGEQGGAKGEVGTCGRRAEEFSLNQTVFWVWREQYWADRAGASLKSYLTVTGKYLDLAVWGFNEKHSPQWERVPFWLFPSSLWI